MITMRLCCALLAIALLFSAAHLFAQENRATISGTVMDPAGAAIANASVSAIEIRTGVRTRTTTNATGSYNIPFLPPGHYTVSVEATGFRNFERKGITLATGDHPVLDINLQIGQAAETVTVSGEAPLIDTASSSTGQSITTKQIEDFPLNGRNPMMIAQLAVGVIPTGNPNVPISPFANAAASGWSIAGTPSQTSEIMIDGAPNATWDNRMAYAPPQEAVQEVRVKAFDGDAGFGHTAGGTINKVMKTGTNQLHGSAYYYMQPSVLAANNFFNNRAGIAVQDTKFNQYGFTVGGPVRIPKVYDGHNKLFWFFAFEKISGSQPNTKFLTVPTAAERQGNFSELLNLGSQYRIFNPYSGTLNASGNVVRSPFYCDASGSPIAPNMTPGPGFGTQPVGTPCNKIPSQLLNPVALAYLQFYPEPNLPGTSTGYSNFGNSNTTDDAYNNQLGRIDWVMSERSRLSANIRRTGYLQNKNNYFGNNAHGLASMLTRDNWGGTVDEVYTINDTTVLNLRANYTRLKETHPSPSFDFDPTSLGFPSYIASTSKFLQLPRITFGNCGSDTTQATSFDCLGQNGADLLPSESASIFGTVVKQWRQHTVKWGVDARRYKLDTQTYGNSVGSYTFGGFGTTNGWTQSASNGSPAPFGQDFASFLLGLPTSGQFDLNTRGTYTSYYTALFVQEDWRIKPNLTINLGVRWDHDMPYTEKLGRTVNGFDFGATNPVAAAAIAAFNSKTILSSKWPTAINGVSTPTTFAVPGGLTFPSPDNGQVYQIDSNMVSPRVGFAWTPGLFNNKTVIRGGFGIFVQPIAMANLNPIGTYSSSPILTQEGFSQTTQFPVPSTLLLPTTTLSNPFPNGITQPAGSTGGLQTFLGQSIDFLNPHMKNPYSERWTFGIQHELTPTMLVEVAYIGNHAVHLPISVAQLNGIPRQYLSTLPNRDASLITTLNASVPNPFAGLIPTLSGGLNGTNTSVRQVLAPFPEYPVADSSSFSSGVTMHNLTVGSSYFNSLTVRVDKRLSHGLQLVSSYAWTKLIERDSYLNNTDPEPEKRISPFDRTHRVVVAANYDLPLGKGRLLDVGNGWLDRLVGGWRINGMYTFQTGAPLLWMNGSTNNPGDYGFCSAPTALGTNYSIKGLCADEMGNLLPPGGTYLPDGFTVDPRGVDGTAFDTSHFVTASPPSNGNPNKGVSLPPLTAAQLAALVNTGLLQYHLRTLPTTFSNLRGDGMNNVDASILKKFTISENAYFQFRVEAFNLLNRVQFGPPSLNPSSGFGKITTQANRPRQVQFGFRFVF